VINAIIEQYIFDKRLIASLASREEDEAEGAAVEVRVVSSRLVSCTQ
jgi:hypothetical protein